MGTTKKTVVAEIEKAPDNLWMIIDSTFRYKTTVGKPSKLIKSGNTLIGEKTKVQGYVSYFLPKDKKGKLIGKPQRMLVLQKLGRSTTEMIPAETVVPYYDYIIKNRNYYTSIGASDLVAQAQRRLSGIPDGALASKFSGATGVGYDVLNSDKIDSGSLLNTPFRYTNEVYSGITIDEEKDALAKISDPNVDLVDAETMNKAYKQSGSKKTFRDWISSEGGRGVLNELTNLVNVLVNRNQTGVQFGEAPSDKELESLKDKDKDKEETKILGMSPVTFGIVAIGLIAVGSFVAYKMISGKAVKS